MRTNSRFATLLLIILLCLLTGCTDTKTNTQSLTLHYDRPAEFYEEALVIGNGTMGATIYGGTQKDCIQLNDITLWTGEPEREVFTPDAYTSLPAIREALFAEDYPKASQLMLKQQGHYSENYQPVGELVIDYGEEEKAEISDYQRWLDIGDATAHNRYQRNGRQVETDYFVSAPDSVVVVRLRSQAPLNARLRFSSVLPVTVNAADGQMIIDGYAAYHSYPSYYAKMEQKHYYDPNRGIHFRTLIRALPKNGEVRCEENGQ